MPGKSGIRPDQSRRSVPVLMPLQRMATRASAAPGASRVTGSTLIRSG